MSQVPYVWDAVNGARTIQIPDAKSAGRINASGVLVGGIKYSPGLPDAFVYDVNSGQYTVLGTLLPAPTQSTAWTTASDINDSNVVVGVRRSDDALVYRGFLWSAAGGFTFLPEPGTGYRPDVRPATINNAGVVAGYIQTEGSEDRAFVWDSARGMRDLNTVTTGLPSGFVLRRASRINEQGWIVGYGSGGGGFTKGFVLKPVEAQGCYADCNADGTLNLADFGCFQTRFALGNAEADCNGDGSLNLSDFGCFQTTFALGCP
jgi:probable HAF family extracellular repeat protein